MTSDRSPAKLPRDQREALLLDAAREEFGAQGYAGASLGAIATRAGVSKALVLTYFGSKDGLYAACASRAGVNLAERIEKVITSPLGPEAMALATLTAIFEGLEGRQQDWNVLTDRTAPGGTTAGDAVRDQRRTIAEQASRGVASLERFATLEADDREILTSIWMSAVTAVVHWWQRHPDRGVQEMAERCGRILATLVD
ncbi:TetR/AcrR family transcriptional regulator [Nocardioides jiangxiensis]|uniref:Helix-turn-helix domain-containing protein n=1 Tax=Nocardioides jiangxiensis TaxID=3064524 RepID=A0ABT9B218_9ACTN|nr:TetR/AcrR family transcriptional regulator [Nocardioides sp. WY-20]MDO7868895.1 helix-turn-helix domain-containing protein [Nocardioides sp. WY-20]